MYVCIYAKTSVDLLFLKQVPDFKIMIKQQC